MSRLCGMKGCTSTQAEKCPVLLMWAKGYPKHKTPPVEMVLNITVCDECIKNKGLTAASFLSDEGFKQICVGMHEIGKAQPDRSTAEVRFELIGKYAKGFSKK